MVDCQHHEPARLCDRFLIPTRKGTMSCEFDGPFHPSVQHQIDLFVSQTTAS